MLTHVHACWYTLCGVGTLWEEGGVWRRWHTLWFGAFRENEVHFFYCAGGKLGEVAGVFLSRKHSLDALRGGTGRWLLESGVVSGAAECAGRTGESPVVSVRCAGVLQPSLHMGPVSTGRYQCLAFGDPQVCGTLCAWVRCAPDASGANLLSVRCTAGDR